MAAEMNAGGSEPFTNGPDGDPARLDDEPSVPDDHPAFDTSIAHQARMYNYWLGGKDNFEADRKAGDAAIAAYPDTVYTARENRKFLGRVVRYLAGEAGIRQFLDIGTGIPTAGNTHEIAQEIAPECRVVYVDYDPVVLAHARALLTSTSQGTTDFLNADVRHTDKVLARAARTLDFSQPVAVTMLALLHVISDADDPYRIVSTIMDTAAPGSYLAISHIASDIEQEKVARAMDRGNPMSYQQFTGRSRADMLRFFDGLELVAPGLVQVQQWRPAVHTDRVTPFWCGLGRKPVSTGPV